jgi:surface protein
MFSNARAFNQNISGWNVGNVTDMTNMCSYTAMTIQNYSNLLINWATKDVKTGVSLGATGLKYTAAAAAARKKLTDPVTSGGKAWKITDGGQAA